MEYKFCPGCGAQGTLEGVDQVFVEQGVYDGNSYEHEGNASLIVCSQCGTQFIDWSIDLEEKNRRDKVFPLVLKGPRGYRAWIMQVRALCLSKGVDADKITVPGDSEADHLATWNGMTDDVKTSCHVGYVGLSKSFDEALQRTHARIEKEYPMSMRHHATEVV